MNQEYSSIIVASKSKKSDDDRMQTNTASFSPNSNVRDFYVPFSAAAVPAAIFALLRVFTTGLAKPGPGPQPLGLVITICFLEVAGVVAMAVVVLNRIDFAFSQLLEYTNGQPPIWRRTLLLMSIAFLLLFDVLTNVAAALAGASFLIVGAIPAFVLYLICARTAIWGLPVRK